MKHLILISLLVWTLQTLGQTDKSNLVGDWKRYSSDSSTFDLLRLNSDGTGLKCFGRTIEGKDTFFLNHITTLRITNWMIQNEILVIESQNNLTFKLNPNYKFILLDNDKLELIGEHLILHLYPSILNRTEFQRKVTYQKADKIPFKFGASKSSCIVKEPNLLTFKPIDSTTQIIEYKGFDDLIPHLIACHSYEYIQKYHDPSYTIETPRTFNRWTFGFGDQNFYISFSDTTESSIVIYYDFNDKMKNDYLSEIKTGNKKNEKVKFNNFNIYKSVNWQGKYSGQIFIENSIIIAYYTRDKKFEKKLQAFITSFKYNHK